MANCGKIIIPSLGLCFLGGGKKDETPFIFISTFIADGNPDAHLAVMATPATATSGAFEQQQIEEGPSTSPDLSHVPHPQSHAYDMHMICPSPVTVAGSTSLGSVLAPFLKDPAFARMFRFIEGRGAGNKNADMHCFQLGTYFGSWVPMGTFCQP